MKSITVMSCLTSASSYNMGSLCRFNSCVLDVLVNGCAYSVVVVDLYVVTLICRA
jgi:hypothetical protein